MPPIWVAPGDARGSQMVAYVNAQASDDPTAWAWATNHGHPEDVGHTLPAADRQMLIQMADLGGQYYSRFNVDPMWTTANHF